MTLLPLIALSMMPCSDIWPDANQGDQTNSPSNLVVWALDQGAGNDLEVTHSNGNRDRTFFRRAGDHQITMGGQQFSAYAAPANEEGNCFHVTSNRMGQICVGDDVDDEAPIDPTLSARLTPPTYGSPSNGFFDNDGDMADFNCGGNGDQSGNLILDIESDEGGSLLALITVKVGGEEVREEAVRINGPTTVHLDIGSPEKAAVEVRLIDQAGNFGEVASVEVSAPTGGCSHSGIGLFLLAGLLGLRRRSA
jgi:hypothetical protein